MCSSKGSFFGILLLAAMTGAPFPALSEAPAVAEPLFEDLCVVSLPIGPYGYRGMPGAILERNDGSLVLAYTQMLPDGKGGDAIATRTSTDKGKTWSEESVLVAKPLPHGEDCYCHPSFLRLQNGQILLSYIYRGSMNPLFGHNYYRRSTDDGKTWGDQLIMTPHRGYNLMHNDKLIQLSTGRLIAPIEFELKTDGGDHAGYVSFTFQSDDNGYTWHRSENMVNLLPVEAQEPHVVELKDGRLMMLMRTYSGYVARAYSTDQGETWSEGEAVNELPLPPHSTSALNVKRVPSTGDLLLLRCTGGPNEPYRRRTPFASVISKDDGATWANERIIAGDPENDYGYPGLTFVDDMALIVYHQRDGLHVARIGIDWFYAK